MSARQKKELHKILLAGAIFLLLLALEKLGALPAAFENRWIALGLYLIPYLLCAAPVLRKAALGVKNGQMLDESFLMAVASIGAFATAEYAEAVAVMLFYQVGEWFQDLAVGRSRRSITELMDIVPAYAAVERPDGAVETVDPDDVAVGDVLVIRPGERIPVDGTVLSGESFVNTAALTGEPEPRRTAAGDQVISGCVNGEGLLRVRAEKAFEDSTVSRILELVETASEKKSRTEQFITRFARYYTPVVVAAAVLLALVPPLFTGAWRTWIYRACAFLVISCPCALVISVPLAFFGGVGAASRGGVLVKGSNYLELLARVRVLVTDKTGTLTRGDFRVTDVVCAPGVSREEVLTAAAAAEGLSTHPIARSIREALGEKTVDLTVVTDAENISGKGITATVAGRSVVVGSPALLRERGADVPELDAGAATLCCVARDGAYLGAIFIRDQVKPGAAEAVAALRKAGVEKVVMLTGDRAAVGEAVGRETGVDAVYAELLPQHKVERVEELLAEAHSRGGMGAYVGDGINDAPVLARSDVGVAMGSLGSDAAIEAADVVVMDDDLRRIPFVMGIARRTVVVARQNIVFALAVKAAVLLLRALGATDMWLAVFADAGVAVLCILNAMRLLRIKNASFKG